MLLSRNTALSLRGAGRRGRRSGSVEEWFVLSMVSPEVSEVVAERIPQKDDLWAVCHRAVRK